MGECSVLTHSSNTVVCNYYLTSVQNMLSKCDVAHQKEVCKINQNNASIEILSC